MDKSDWTKREAEFWGASSSLDIWSLCDELTVVQAALLIAGLDPGDECNETYVETWEPHNQPPKYRAARAAIVHAIVGRRLPAKIAYRARDRRQEYSEQYGLLRENTGETERIEKNAFLRQSTEIADIFEPSPELIVDTDPDLNRTTVMVEALKTWLRGRGLETGFFFPATDEEAEYLNPLHSRYAPKLAAAVRAWQAVEHPAGKSPKAALEKWLRENAALHGLTDNEGKTNEQGIQECAKVANWETKGGAPKTPSGITLPVGKPARVRPEITTNKFDRTQQAKASGEKFCQYDEFDDDAIPF